MATDVSDQQQSMREALKRTAVALKGSGVPFALTGGYAVWARGGPEPEHDVDFVVAETDQAQAAEALAASGLRVERPPEDWLFKVFSDGAMVDVTFRAMGHAVEREQLGDVELMEVESVQMPVLLATDVMTHKLAALDEHYCDFSVVLPAARALREQVDWSEVAERVSGNDFAVVFLQLLERLGITNALESPEDD